MAKNFGRVNVSITASTGGLTRGLANAGKQLSGFGATVARFSGANAFGSVFGGMAQSVVSALNPLRLLSGAFRSLAGQAIVLAGIAAPFVALARAASSLDQISKDARRLGLATTELQNLTQVAEEAGVGGEQLVGILTRMQRQTVALAQGSNTAKAAFATLGLSVQDLAGLSAEGQFAAISRQIMALPTAAERSAAAISIFGRSGAQAMGLIEAAAGGAVGEMAGLRDALGVNVSDQQGQEIERMNDMLGRMGMAFNGFITQFLAGIAPVVADVANRMVQFFAQNESGFSLAGSAAKVFTDVLLAIEPAFMAIYDFVQQIAPVAQVTFELVGQAFTVVKDLFMAGVSQMNTIFAGFFGETAGGFESTNSVAMVFANGLRMVAGTVTYLYGAFQILFGVFARLEQAFSNLLSSLSGGLSGILSTFADAAESAGLTGLADTLRDGAQSAGDFANAAANQADGWGEAAATAFGNGLENMENPFAAFDDAMARAMTPPGEKPGPGPKPPPETRAVIGEAIRASSQALRAIVVGSSEGEAFRNNIMRGGDPRLDVKDDARKTADNTERAADALDDIADRLDPTGLAVIG
jgi:hypothetical protein